jgi:hypothetical protein
MMHIDDLIIQKNPVGLKTPLGEIVENLKALRENGPRNDLFGICGNVPNGRVQLKEELLKSWKWYTGCDSYPIPSDREKRPKRQQQELAAERYDEYGSHWDKDTEYGQLRWDLLDHLIDKLEALL